MTLGKLIDALKDFEEVVGGNLDVEVAVANRPEKRWDTHPLFLISTHTDGDGMRKVWISC